MTAFEGNDVRKHRIKNVAGCSTLMDRHYYVEQLLHLIVELLCATRNNAHSAQVYISFFNYVLIIYI